VRSKLVLGGWEVGVEWGGLCCVVATSASDRVADWRWLRDAALGALQLAEAGGGD
jgi:hypothetical protein